MESTRKIMKDDYPFEACKTCKSLEDCPFPDIGEGGMSLPMIPDCCKRQIDIMKATLKKHKVVHKLIKEN